MVNKTIKKLLIDRDMSLKDLAEKTGYTRVHMGNIVNGRVRSPKGERLISFVLDCPRDELFRCKQDLQE